jgi:hypothetical protein
MKIDGHGRAGKWQEQPSTSTHTHALLGKARPSRGFHLSRRDRRCSTLASTGGFDWFAGARPPPPPGASGGLYRHWTALAEPSSSTRPLSRETVRRLSPHTHTHTHTRLRTRLIPDSTRLCGGLHVPNPITPARPPMAPPSSVSRPSQSCIIAGRRSRFSASKPQASPKLLKESPQLVLLLAISVRRPPASRAQTTAESLRRDIPD